eukprot:scaffold256361_cov31-Tisochrysis_lutea.AAC.3
MILAECERVRVDAAQRCSGKALAHLRAVGRLGAQLAVRIVAPQQQPAGACDGARVIGAHADRHDRLSGVQLEREERGRSSGSELGLKFLLRRGARLAAHATRKQRSHEAAPVAAELTMRVVAPTEHAARIGQRKRVE